jgi:aryl-alcohol dehydrogenase-like predicted oxidoreductase
MPVGSEEMSVATATALPRRRLGGLDVPAVGYGAMVLSPGMYGPIDAERADAALRAALDAGRRSSTPVTATARRAVNAHPDLVRGYAEQSLRELGTDRIDLYYPHFPDPEVPLEDTVGAVADLVQDGLVRHLGLSNVTAGQLRRAHAGHPVAAVVPIPGSRKPHHIEENLAAARVELSTADLAEVDAALAVATPVGRTLLEH